LDNRPLKSDLLLTLAASLVGRARMSNETLIKLPIGLE